MGVVENVNESLKILGREKCRINRWETLDDASEATTASNYAAFRPQKGALVLHNRLPAVKIQANQS